MLGIIGGALATEPSTEPAAALRLAATVLEENKSVNGIYITMLYNWDYTKRLDLKLQLELYYT